MFRISASSSLPGIEHACVVILGLQSMHIQSDFFMLFDYAMPKSPQWGETLQRVRIHYNCIGAFDVPEVEVLLETRKGVAVCYSPEVGCRAS